MLRSPRGALWLRRGASRPYAVAEAARKDHDIPDDREKKNTGTAAPGR